MVRARKDEVRDALDRITAGMSYRETFGLESTWLDLETKFFSVSQSADCGPNIVQARGDALVAALSIPEMYCMVEGSTRESAQSAPIIEALANQTLAALDIADAMEDALTSAYVFGKGLLKIGFDSEYGYEPSLRLGGLGGTLSQYGPKGELLESGRARSGMPWTAPVLPHDVVVPWGTVRLEDAEEIWHRVVRHIDDVKADLKYSDTGDLEPVLSMRDVRMGYSQVRENPEESLPQETEGEDSEREYIELWEGMTKRDRLVRTIAMTGEGEAKLLRRETNELQIDNVLPWVDVGLTLRTRSFWVTPLAYYIAAAQDELDDIHWQAKLQRRASLLKLLVKKGALTPANMDRLLDGEPAAVVEVEETFGELRDVVLPVGMNNSINTLLHMEEEHVLRSARETIGMSRAMTGEYDQKNRRPAAETYAVERGGELRLGRRQKSLRRSYHRLVQILMGLVAKHWTLPRAVRYIGADGASKWGDVTQRLLRDGKWAYKVNFSPEHYETPGGRQREALQLLGAFAGNPLVDQSGLVENLVTAFNMPQLRAAQPGATDADLRVRMSEMQGATGTTAATNRQGA